MTKLTEIEKKQFGIRSFEKRWGLETPNLHVSLEKEGYVIHGGEVRISTGKLRNILLFEGLETVRPLFEEALWIERRLTHKPLELIVSFHKKKVAVKKKLNSCVTADLGNMELAFLDLMKRCGVPELEKRALNYETNFVFETDETKKERKELLQHFNYLTINWVKEIEKVMQKEFEKYLR